MIHKKADLPPYFRLGLVILCVFLLASTNSQKSAPPCSFILQNNKTMLEKLAYDFDKESANVILEYIIRFSHEEDTIMFINRSNYDSFEPLRWYRTQGAHSSQLLLSYELYFGHMKHILDLNVKKINIELKVIPPGCFKELKDESVESLLEEYLLQDFNIDANSVKHSFEISEDVEICSTKLDIQHQWGALRYRCCGHDGKDHMYCNDLTASDWMIALEFFILTVTIILALYSPAMIPTPYSKEKYDFRAENGSEIKFIMKVITAFKNDYDNVPTINLETRADKMKQFQQKLKTVMENKKTSDDTNSNDGRIFEVYVKKARFRISKEKVFTLHKTTFNILRSALDFFLKNENHRDCCKEKWCSELCLRFRRFMKTFLILFVLALPSYPLAEVMCIDDLWFRKVARAFSQRGYADSLFFSWRIPKEFGRGLTGFFYVSCLIHAVLCAFYKNRTVHTKLSDFRDKKIVIAQFFRDEWKRLFPLGRCSSWINAFKYIRQSIFVFLTIILLPVGFLFYFIITTPLGLVFISYVCRDRLNSNDSVLEEANHKGRWKRAFLFSYWFTAGCVGFVLIIGANFVVNAAALLTISVIVKGSDIYNVIPMAILLFFYIRDCFRKVQKPYNIFVNTLLSTDACRDLYLSRRETFPQKDSVYQKQQKLYPENESVKKSATYSSNSTKESKNPLFGERNNKLRLNLKHPFVYWKEKTMSKKFLLHCASMNCMGAPGSLWDNYEKAWIRFLKIGLFVVFVFLVVMAFGYISYISPWNRVYITFVGGLLPLVIDKFSNIDQSSYEIDSSDHIFLAEFKRKMTSFSQKHVVDDFIDAEITETVALDPLIDLIVIIGSKPTTTDGETAKSLAQESNQGTTVTEKTVIEVENEDCEIWNHVGKNYAMGQTKTQQSTVEMQGKIQAKRTNKSDERESQQIHHVLVKEGSKQLKKSNQQGGRQTKRQGSKAVSLDESETQGRQTLQEVGGAIPINQSDEIESHESHRSDKIETQSAHHSNESESRSGVQSAEKRSAESFKNDELINIEKNDVENRERTHDTSQCDPDSNRTALKLSPNKVTKETNESNL